jgi:hypothetical protein
MSALKERTRWRFIRASRSADVRAVRTRLRLPIALGVALGLLAGCGRGASAEEARFVAEANAICAQEVAILNRSREPTSPTQAIGYLPKAIAIIERESGRLAALAAPASKRGEVQAAIGAGRQLGAVLARFLRQLRTGSYELATFAQVQQQSTALRDQMNAHFRKAGLGRCVTSA